MSLRERVRTTDWRVPPSEVALTVIATLLSAVDVGQAAQPLLALVLILLAGSTLLWRLRQPLLPLVAFCAVSLYVLPTAPGQYPPQTLFLGVLVAVYSAAAHLAGRRAAVAGALSLLAIWLANVATREVDVTDFLPFVLWGAPWLVGRLARRQALQARADGARAAALLAAQEQETADAASRERDRIARELHDVVAHAVSLVVVQAGAERLARPDSPSIGALQAIETTGRQALVELRAMLGVLRDPAAPEAKGPQPDLTALPALVEQVRSAGLPVQLRMSGDGRVPGGVALSAYRVVQEALTNALRHGGPVPTLVTVGVDAAAVQVEVSSRLPASPQGRSAGCGRGLLGMRERVDLHDGTLDAGPEGDDWVVRARLPLAAVAR